MIDMHKTNKKTIKIVTCYENHFQEYHYDP